MSNQSASAINPNLPKGGSIGSELATGANGSAGVKRGSQGVTVDPSETNSNVGSVSAAQSVGDHEDLASLMNKFKALRRENQQLRNLLR